MIQGIIWNICVYCHITLEILLKTGYIEISMGVNRVQNCCLLILTQTYATENIVSLFAAVYKKILQKWV